MKPRQKVLAAKFFQRPTLAVARDLLGTTLAKKMPGGEIVRAIITEVEAYDGPRDLACHAARGRTTRNEVMFRRGGCWYVYFVYGFHYMLNIVTGPAGYPAAVLIRGVENISGPGRLTKQLDITRELNGRPAVPASGLWLEEKDHRHRNEIIRTARIGVAYAGPVWSKKKYRFVMQN